MLGGDKKNKENKSASDLMIQVIIYNEINVACFQEKWGSNISFSYITQIKYRFDCWLRQAKEATDIFILKLTNNDSFFVFCFFFWSSTVFCTSLQNFYKVFQRRTEYLDFNY